MALFAMTVGVVSSGVSSLVLSKRLRIQSLLPSQVAQNSLSYELLVSIASCATQTGYRLYNVESTNSLSEF